MRDDARGGAAGTLAGGLAPDRRRPYLRGMHRIWLALLAVIGLAAATAAQPAFRLPEGDRMHVVGHSRGWTVLRDTTAPPGPATGMMLIRVQRPVAPASRPGHLARLLRSFRPFHLGDLPAEAKVRVGGLPGTAIETTGFAAPGGEPLVVHAVALYAPNRSWLLIASAPSADWPGLEAEMARLLAGFRPG
jgi:hypothetical protein